MDIGLESQKIKNIRDLSHGSARLRKGNELSKT